MRARTVVIGIDPGITGGIAYLGADWCAVKDLPTREEGDGRCIDVRALAQQVEETIPTDARVLACMERLLPGGAKQGSNNTYSIGVQHRTRALIEATLTLLGVDIEGVTPQQWKKFYDLGGKAPDEKAQTARRAIELAQQLYPDLLPDLRLAKHQNRAEAVLIGHFYRKVKA